MKFQQLLKHFKSDLKFLLFVSYNDIYMRQIGGGKYLSKNNNIDFLTKFDEYQVEFIDFDDIEDCITICLEEAAQCYMLQDEKEDEEEQEN